MFYGTWNTLPEGQEGFQCIVVNLQEFFEQVARPRILRHRDNFAREKRSCSLTGCDWTGGACARNATQTPKRGEFGKFK